MGRSRRNSPSRRPSLPLVVENVGADGRSRLHGENARADGRSRLHVENALADGQANLHVETPELTAAQASMSKISDYFGLFRGANYSYEGAYF